MRRPGSGSARRATPIGNSGDAAAAATTASNGPAERHRNGLESADRDALRSGQTQRALCRLVDRGERDLAAQHDGDGDETRQRGDAREHPQRHREHVDGVLGALSLDREVLDVELR